MLDHSFIFYGCKYKSEFLKIMCVCSRQAVMLHLWRSHTAHLYCKLFIFLHSLYFLVSTSFTLHLLVKRSNYLHHYLPSISFVGLSAKWSAPSALALHLLTDVRIYSWHNRNMCRQLIRPGINQHTRLLLPTILVFKGIVHQF